jgi:dihydroorotate dehydrogenase electron transfer subunit
VNGNFQLLYRVVGKGTALLSQKKPAEKIEVIGPLGNGFILKKSKKAILVAGGLGIAPIFALAESLVKTKPIFFYGVKTKNDILCLNQLKSTGIDPIISTDDGTFGKKGNVVNVLRNYLRQHSISSTQHILYACGPQPMLNSLSLLAKKYRLKGYIALEQNMACGLGACLGCVINTVKGYKRVCKEGPVFPIEEIVWNNNYKKSRGRGFE